jgi:hypothetical protein
MQPWQKIRARRYCAAPEGAEPGFIHWTEVTTFIGGSEEVTIIKTHVLIIFKDGRASDGAEQMPEGTQRQNCCKTCNIG